MPEHIQTIVRIALYTRVSTEEQREGQTIDSQLAELERFSREKAWPIVDIYKDDGWSGGIMARPQLDRLRDDAQKGKFDAVLVNDVDRLARDVSHLGVIKRDLERHGVKVIFRKLPPDTSATYNLMVNILGSFAEFERELISDRVRRGRRHKVEVKHQYLGSNTSYGYRYRPKDRVAGKEGFLELVHEEAEVVQQIFSWVDQEGLSARRVVNRLNELKVPTKKGAPRWGRSSILRILKNEMYAGTWHYNKYEGSEPKTPTPRGTYKKRTKCSLRKRPRGDWIPLVLPESLRIISRDRWKRVQEQLSRNLTFSPRNEHHTYLLKGLVRCGACGAGYMGDPGHGYFSYRCSARCKQMPMIREHTLNTAVQHSVAKVMLDPNVILTPLRELEAANAREKKHTQDTLENVERERKRLDDEEQRILDAYRLSIISAEQLKQQLGKVDIRRNKVHSKRAELMQDNLPLEHVETTVAEYCGEAAENLAGFTEDEWRQFLRTIIRTISFHGDHITIQGRIPSTEVGYSDEIRFQRTSDLK